MTYYSELLEKMTQTYRNYTRHSVDEASDIGIRLKVLATQVDLLCQQVDEVDRQAFPLTSTGEALDRHAAARGLTRKGAIAAKGMLQLTRPSPPGYDILIPAGTICQTAGNNPMMFRVDSDSTMWNWATSAYATAVALQPGAAGNVKSGTITVLVTPPTGVTGVTQTSDFYGGADEESDEALKKRMLDSYQRPDTGHSIGFYRQRALSYSEVRTAAVLPGERGSGTMDVVIYGAGALPSHWTFGSLEEDFAQERSLGVDVLVRGAGTLPVSLAVDLAVREGWDYTSISDQCKEKLQSLMDQLDIGEPLRLSQVTAELMGCEGVFNCKLTQPTADITPQKDLILTAGSIVITKMEGS